MTITMNAVVFPAL